MKVKEQEEKYIQMTTQPVERLICKMAVPSIISVLITAIYNMVDTIYVGKISTEATAAVGIVFSYMAVIQAVGYFFGHGSANYISRALGAKDRGEAEKMAATGFFSSILCGIFIAAVGLCTMTPFLRVLGATNTILQESKDYLFPILIGTPWIMSSFVLNNQMRLQGNASLGMIGISIGAVLNVGLDPLFIFTLNMGVKGAAIATSLSQLVSFMILLYLSGKKDGIRIQWKNFFPSGKRYVEIIGGGLPSLGRQGVASVAAVVLNRYAGLYGDSAIAAFSVVNRIVMFSSSALLGFGQGFQPVSGFNYGAKLYDRVRKSFWFCVKVATAYGIALAVVELYFAPHIIQLFRSEDEELIRIGAQALRFQCCAFPLLGYVTIANMYLQNIRKTVSASVLAIARQGLFFIPIAIFSASHFGLLGLQIAQPVSDILTFVLSLPLGMSSIKHIGM